MRDELDLPFFLLLFGMLSWRRQMMGGFSNAAALFRTDEGTVKRRLVWGKEGDD